MQVQKQFVSVPLNLGVDTKTDPKSVGFGAMLTLENGSFHNTGSICKRSGHDLLGTQVEQVISGLIPDSEDIEAAVGLSVFRDELLLFDGARVFSYLEATRRWGYRGRASVIEVTDKQVIRNSYDQADPDVLSAHGVRYVVWDDARGDAKMSVIDEATGAAYIHDGEIYPGGALRPKLVLLGDAVLLFYISGVNLRVSRFYPNVNPTTPEGAFTASFDVVTGVTSSSNYDVCVIGSYVYIAAELGLGYIALYQMDEDFSTSLMVGDGGAGSYAVTVFGDIATGVWVASADGGGIDLYRWDYASTVNRVTALTTAPPTAPEVIMRMTGVTDGEAIATLYYEVGDPLYPHHNYVSAHSFEMDGTEVAAVAVLVRSVGLAGKAFRYEDQNYFLACHNSTLQATYFLVNGDGDVVSRVNPTVGSARTSCLLSEATEVSAGVYAYAMQVKGRLLSAYGEVYAQLGVNVAEFNLATPTFACAELDGNLIIGGGLIQAYDGKIVNEHGFHLFPENVEPTVFAGTGLLEAGKTYFWKFIYEWTDAQGFIHRSAPDADGNTLVATANDSVLFSIPTLRLTSRLDVRVAVYRTAGDGSVYYRLPEFAFNSTTTDTIGFLDNYADVEITSNEVLYTTGGVLEHIAPGAATITTAYRGRVFLAGMSDGNRILHSTRTVPGEAVAFNDALSIDVDPSGGPVTGLGVLDDKLIIFKANAIYAMAGDGPTDTGSQNDYGDPSRISSDVGCISPRSIVATPAGLMFKSSKGIYALDRSLTVTYVGAPVDTYRDNDVLGAAVVPEFNQVRFVSSSGKTLVYHYDVDQWSVFTGQTAVGCVIWDNQYVYAKPDGHALIENPEAFTDGGSSYSLKFVTAWLQTGQIQGFQRAWRCYILGAYKGAHKLRVAFGYDHHDEFEQELLIDATGIMDGVIYGDDATYGATSPYGGEFPLYQFGIHLARQKCTAIRVSIEDTQTSGTREAYALSSIAFLVGTKAPGPKLPGSRSFGSTAST
jgi:hypothetical protein